MVDGQYGNKMKDLNTRLKNIKLLLTDVDGVLTDTGVYYSSSGEELKKFSIRDVMGVERLRKTIEVDTGIITGENSVAVSKRAEKLMINELHLGIKNKLDVLDKVCTARNLNKKEIAYIGDDVNDLEIINAVGVSSCPADAMSEIKKRVDIILDNRGGEGAFREFSELIIEAKSN
jgi:YrbI family 3-deoxy-D-manno-octulosonate 8-phosphate phosphatase